VPIYHLMEDAATAEISRAQIWQWRRHGARIEDGPAIDASLVRTLLDEEMAKIHGAVGDERFRSGKFEEAASLFRDLVLADDFTEFLTLPAYELVTTLS
jgi:malate synthase